MLSKSAFRYTGAYVFIFLGYFSFNSTGIWAYSLVLFSFGIIPIIELLVSPDSTNSEPQKDLWYDIILYSLVVLYAALWIYFLNQISQIKDSTTLIGQISAMGMLHGIFGINMAHELGHRKRRLDRWLAQFLLWTSQYAHFFIEHNRGHHKRVATPQDPATARQGENVYSFWIRTVRDSYLSAWNLENDRLRRHSSSVLSWQNDMVKYSIFQLALLVMIGLIFGWFTLLCYISAAFFGILLLETINYIEHYGLVRKKISESAYERVQHKHSWNSDHILGRFLLFELTRHSHHHENSTIKYPRLQSKRESPQLPTGYPGMMLLSFLPPLFFKVIDRRISE